MQTLSYSFNIRAQGAYIIRIPGNEKSQRLARRCSESCDQVDQPWQYWDAYDGTGSEIVAPQHSINDSFMRMVKITDHYMTRSEVACALSHISLWRECALLDQPIVILEHDAVMLAPYRFHTMFNSICYLGGSEQVEQGWKILPTPPHSTDGTNYHFICRAHAYAIDPTMAKNLLSHVLKLGIHRPLDMMLRADLFSIHQTGVFAYDLNEPSGGARSPDTVITGRPDQGRAPYLNTDLKI